MDQRGSICDQCMLLLLVVNYIHSDDHRTMKHQRSIECMSCVFVNVLNGIICLNIWHNLIKM